MSYFAEVAGLGLLIARQSGDLLILRGVAGIDLVWVRDGSNETVTVHKGR